MKETRCSRDSELISVTINSGVGCLAQLNVEIVQVMMGSNYKKVEAMILLQPSENGKSEWCIKLYGIRPAYMVKTPKENISSLFFLFTTLNYRICSMYFQKNSQGLTSDT